MTVGVRQNYLCDFNKYLNFSFLICKNGYISGLNQRINLKHLLYTVSLFKVRIIFFTMWIFFNILGQEVL